MMSQNSLLRNLKREDMPFVIDAEFGLAWKVHERLWGFANGRTTEEELADFLAEKLDSAEQNIVKLEEEVEYPEVAAEHHAQLHESFLIYLAALQGLEEFLWDEPGEITLPDIMRALIQADKSALEFHQGIDEMVDPTVAVDLAV